jgi:hypothetical protein
MLRSFQLLKTFNTTESWDMVTFGGEGVGPPGPAGSGALRRLHAILMSRRIRT